MYIFIYNYNNTHSRWHAKTALNVEFDFPTGSLKNRGKHALSLLSNCFTGAVRNINNALNKFGDKENIFQTDNG